MIMEEPLDALRTPLLDPNDNNNQEQQQQENNNIIIDAVNNPSSRENTTSGVNNGESEEDIDNRRISTCCSSSSVLLYATLLPDHARCHFRDEDDEEDERNILYHSFFIKLLKFVAMTFGFIFLLYWMVSHRHNHRNLHLQAWHIWVFDGTLIVQDCIVFFLVGRLWLQPGVDHLAWIGIVILSNLYFECQHYISWMRHAMTIYEMHCIWPWQLWMFVVGICVPVVLVLILWHVIYACRNKLLLQKLVEISFCLFFFLVPMVSTSSSLSNFHFHHWFAGWLIGMHCNFDVWWSRAAMAWCWGMYINGIAVYGRAPVLTCDYAYFLSIDQKCPFLNEATTCDRYGLQYFDWSMSFWTDNFINDDPMEPVDWRNCSSDGYHP